MRRIIVLLCGYAFLLCGAFSSAVAETSVFAEGDATVAPLVAKPDKLIPVPLMRQGRDYTCGVACVQALLRYAGYAFDVREDILLAPLGTTPEDGTPLSGIVDFLNQVTRSAEGGKEARVMEAEVRQNMTIAELTRRIDAGSPVICLIQAWWADAKGHVEPRHDYADEWESGHYVIAVGYDRERIYFMDPSLAGNYGYIPRRDLDARWHDVDVRQGNAVRYEHAGIVVTVLRPEYKADEYQHIW